MILRTNLKDLPNLNIIDLPEGVCYHILFHTCRGSLNLYWVLIVRR